MILPLPRPTVRMSLVALVAAPVATSAWAEPIFERETFGMLPEPVRIWLDGMVWWPWLLLLAAILCVAVVIVIRLRLSRRAARRKVLGIGRGARFRAVDAMCHAVLSGREIVPARLTRALEIARATTDMDFTEDHLREAARRADRTMVPGTFGWMRHGLERSERLVIFNAAISVLLADGPLTRSDRRFLRVLARGLRLGRRELRDLSHLVEDD